MKWPKLYTFGKGINCHPGHWLVFLLAGLALSCKASDSMHNSEVVCQHEEVARFREHYVYIGEKDHIAGFHLRGGQLPAYFVGQESYFVVDYDLPDIHFWDCYAFFAGPSQFAGSTNFVKHGIEVWFKPLDAGLFQVHVEVLARNRSSATGQRYTTWLPIEGSPFSLQVLTTGSKEISLKAGQSLCSEEDKLLPPNQTCRDIADGQGRWIDCEQLFGTSGCPGMEGNQFWTPDSCKYEYVNSEEIVSENKPLWIAFLGTSVSRGWYWSTVDQLVRDYQTDLRSLATSKCWGWQDIKLGNTRVSYRDLRSDAIMGISRLVVDDYVELAKQAVHSLGEEVYHGAKGPDLVFMELYLVEEYLSKSSLIAQHINLVASCLGDDWHGRFYFGTGFFNPQSKFAESFQFEILLREHARINKQAHFYNFQAMSLASLHTMESNISTGVMTQHHHHKCSNPEAHVEDNTCGRSVEMAAQIVFNIVKTIPRRPATRLADKEPNVLRVCEVCPESLFPFSVIPKSQETCVEICKDS